MPNTVFTIDHSEDFPHLTKAPIVEAVLDIRFILNDEWKGPILKGKLEEFLAGYKKIEETREIKYQVSVGNPPNQTLEDLGCIGLRTVSEDDRYIVQFNRDSFIFSRVNSYDDWPTFITEAKKLFSLYNSLTGSLKIIRIGVRFINRLMVSKDGLHLENYYTNIPRPLNMALPLEGFLHHDVMRLPNYPYSVNLIKATQALFGVNENKIALMLDIDVFMNKELDGHWEEIDQYLKDMRWIKNKIFFESLTPKAIEMCK